jgi:tetratricopeptide (TPR) repeat protein
MGICAKLQHAKSGRNYALKTVRPEILESEEAYKRFTEELKLWITLSSNGGIVPAYAIERVNELPVMCAKWMPEGSLRPHLASKDPRFFHETFDRMIRSLEWAWRVYAVVHRDLKPENVLLDSDRWAYISDWGLARTALAALRAGSWQKEPARLPGALNLTAAGSFLGTLLYAAPEQILDAASADNLADIYSLGCIMYEWETGAPPFLGRTAEEVAYGHLHREPARIGHSLRSSNLGADKVIMKCLEKRAKDRFQGYDELLAAMRESARQRKVSWNSIPVSQALAMPRVGWNQFRDYQKRIDPRQRGQRGDYAVVAFEELEPYLKEAEALMGVAEWQKAADILATLFIPEMVEALPDFDLHQMVVINYGRCLSMLGRDDDAVRVFAAIAGASSKPTEFYLNYSCALLGAGKAAEAEYVSRQGLGQTPQDGGILGNLTIALRLQEKLAEALESAKARLSLERNVHSLEEVANVLSSLAAEEEDRNWPEAFEMYKASLEALEEAKALNPRFGTVRYSIAKAWSDLRNNDHALAEMEEVWKLPLHPSLRVACAALATRIFFEEGEFRQTVSFADKWLQRYPADVRLLRPRAQALVDGFVIGHIKDGVRVFEKSSIEFFEQIVENKKERVPTDFCYLARLWDWMGKLDDALRLLARGGQLFPSSYDISFWRASLLLASQPHEAYAHALEAARRGAWHAPAWELLSRVCSALGRRPEAGQATQRAATVRAERERLAKSLPR